MQNGHVERLIGSIRRECLDHIIVFGEAHLRLVLKGPNSSVTEQGCAGVSARAAGWEHHRSASTRRATPSLRAGLSSRQGQPKHTQADKRRLSSKLASCLPQSSGIESFGESAVDVGERGACLVAAIVTEQVDERRDPIVVRVQEASNVRHDLRQASR